MSPCATPEQLERFLLDQLEATEHEAVEAHIEECDACQQLLEHMTTIRDSAGPSPPDREVDARIARLLERVEAKGPWQENPGRHPTEPNGTGSRTEEPDDEEQDDGIRSLPLCEGYPKIDGLRIIREIGRGGMGVVYKARDASLGRIVAIKTLAEGQHATPEQLERFRAEAQAVARLRHPNIIAIHVIGEHEGRPYLSLEFAEGGSLAQRLAEKPMAPREAAALLETLARAVHVAHQAGVVHRDLKPSNILLDADGVPKVADFGLAKLLDSDSGRTLSGQIVGTPSYMAPEQAEGHSKRVGPAADVYALGAILYQALTGRPPFLGESALETLRMVASTDVVAPHLLRTDIPRDLETICLKCLGKDPLKRYSGAQELADDLQRFLQGRPITARPASVPERTIRWCRRNPWVAASIVLLGLGTGVSTWQAVRATVAESRARRERDRAEQETKRAVQAEAATREQRDRAEHARDQAFSAINTLALTDKDQMLSEELRPYREMLLDAGLLLATEMVREGESDRRSQGAQALALMEQAKLLAEKGDRSHASEVGSRAVELFEGLVRRDPTDAQNRAALAQLLHQFAVIAKDREAARSATRRSNELYEALLKEGPRSDQSHIWIRMIASNLRNIGHAYTMDTATADGRSRAGLLRKAIEAFREGERLCEQALQEGDRSDEILSALAHNEIYLCRGYWGLAGGLEDPGERDASLRAAAETGKESISHFRTLVERRPENYAHSLALHGAQNELGRLFLEARELHAGEAAISCFNDARETLKAMAGRHGRLVSRMVAIQVALAIVDYHLTLAYEKVDVARYYAGPRRAIMAEMHEICDKLELVQPLSWDLRMIYADTCLEMVDYRWFDGERRDLTLLEKAERLWDQLHREAPGNNQASGMLIVARRELADALEVQGRIVEASRWRSRSPESARGNPELLCQLAALYAGKAGFVGKCPSKRSARDLEARRQRLSRHGVSMLQEAIADGFSDVGRLRNDPELALLRSSSEFQVLVLDVQFPAKPFATRP